MEENHVVRAIDPEEADALWGKAPEGYTHCVWISGKHHEASVFGKIDGKPSECAERLHIFIQELTKEKIDTMLSGHPHANFILTNGCAVNLLLTMPDSIKEATRRPPEVRWHYGIFIQKDPSRSVLKTTYHSEDGHSYSMSFPLEKVSVKNIESMDQCATTPYEEANKRTFTMV